LAHLPPRSIPIVPLYKLDARTLYVYLEHDADPASDTWAAVRDANAASVRLCTVGPASCSAPADISRSLTGAGNRIRRNYVHDTFDGIDIRVTVSTSVRTMTGTPKSGKSHRYKSDSGIEIGGAAINLRVHDNTLRRTFGCIRRLLRI
jgi:hypothetical protein